MAGRGALVGGAADGGGAAGGAGAVTVVGAEVGAAAAPAVPTVPTWEARLLARFGSAVGDETVAALVTVVPADEAATRTVGVTVRVARGANEAAFVQVTVVPAAEHDHPGPAADRYVRPAGRVTTTRIGPAAGSGPALVTVTAYSAVRPGTSDPIKASVTPRSADLTA